MGSVLWHRHDLSVYGKAGEAGLWGGSDCAGNRRCESQCQTKRYPQCTVFYREGGRGLAAKICGRGNMGGCDRGRPAPQGLRREMSGDNTADAAGENRIYQL